MTALSKDEAHYRARIGALSRDRAPDDPELAQARRDFQRARWSARVEQLVAEAPPLTDEQLSSILAMLGGRVVR